MYNGNMQGTNINPFAQQRLNYMEQRYPQFAGNNYGQGYGQQMQQVLYGRMVTCFDEVKACPINMDGSINYFPNISSGEIYTKQLSIDGTPAYEVYRKVEHNELNKQQQKDNEVLSTDMFVTREEYNNVINSLNNMGNILQGLLGGINYASQSNAVAANDDVGSGQPTTINATNDGEQSNVCASSKNGTRKK